MPCMHVKNVPDEELVARLVGGDTIRLENDSKINSNIFYGSSINSRVR
jgi:hypothetical protein